MKKFVIICIILIVGYFGICTLNIVKFNQKISTHENGYYKKTDIAIVLNQNEEVFNELIRLFENEYNTIMLDYIYSKPILDFSERDYEQYTTVYFKGDQLNKINKCLSIIFFELRFTDVIIENNHVYRIQQRGNDNTEVGAVFDQKGDEKARLMGNWYFHYRSDWNNKQTNYAGRWLYDILYNYPSKT